MHGEAIAIGLVLAARLSVALGILDQTQVDRVIHVVKKYDLPDVLREPLPLEALIEAARKDKKARAGKLKYVAMESMGRAVTRDDVTEDLVRELWLSAGVAG